MVEIRCATTFDSIKVIKYLKQIGSETDNLSFGKEGLGAPSAGIKSFIAASKCYYIAVENNNIIGSVQLSPGRRRFSHAAEFSISTTKEYWGTGLAQKLFEKALLWAKDNQIRKINLEVRQDNLRAIKFYERNGFQNEGVITRMFLHKGEFVDGYRYGLQLN